MPSFKPKTNKKIKVSKKYSTTLDGKHNEFVNEFNNNELFTIPQLKAEKKHLKEELANTFNLSIDQIMEKKDRIKEINENIKKLKEKKTN